MATELSDQPALIDDVRDHAVCAVSCVSCHVDSATVASSRLKLLRCLHSMCITCLKDNVRKDGTVTCFKCLDVGGSALPGARLEDSLVDWPTSDANGGPKSSDPLIQNPEAQAICQNSDCDGAFEPAVSVCLDCGMQLCDGHEKLHVKRKRSSLEHRVIPITEASCRKSETVYKPMCCLHLQLPVTSHCSKCKMLACERCHDRFHRDCSDGVEDIQTAAEAKREDWKARLSASSDAWREKLSSTRSSIDTYTNDINDKVEELSVKINADFEQHIKNIRKRQQKVLDDLDAARWKALHCLEKQSEIVDAKMYQLDSCEHLVRNLGDSGLLAAENILDTHIGDIVNRKPDFLPNKEDYSVPLQVAYTKFADDECSYVSDLGRLINADDFTSDTRAGKEKAVVIHPALDPDPWISAIHRHGASGSISDHGLHVDSTSSALLPVSTLGSYCHGIVQCSVKVRGRLFLGVAEERCTAGNPFLGWFSRENNQACAVGRIDKLSQPWRPGDVIVLRLDCHQHRLTGTNERTGCSDTIVVPQGRLCFAAKMTKKSQIKFLR